jgi:hypothetical protein
MAEDNNQGGSTQEDKDTLTEKEDIKHFFFS